MRVGGKSAEAIVAKRSEERRTERRAEGEGAVLDGELWSFGRSSEVAGRDNCGRYPGQAKEWRKGAAR